MRKIGLKFTETGKRVSLVLFEGGYILVDLEKVGKWTYEESIYYVKNESDVNRRKPMSKIHIILNHKRVEQIGFAYRNARNLDTEKRKFIKEVVKNCEIYRKNGNGCNGFEGALKSKCFVDSISFYRDNKRDSFEG